MKRRDLLKTIATAAGGALSSQFLSVTEANRAFASNTNTLEQQTGPRQLLLKDYQPKSMLHVPETHVPRSRFPNIDFHTHLSWIDRKGKV